jgi:hypothetical protein
MSGRAVAARALSSSCHRGHVRGETGCGVRGAGSRGAGAGVQRAAVGGSRQLLKVQPEKQSARGATTWRLQGQAMGGSNRGSRRCLSEFSFHGQVGYGQEMFLAAQCGNSERGAAESVCGKALRGYIRKRAARPGVTAATPPSRGWPRRGAPSASRLRSLAPPAPRQRGHHRRRYRRR